MRRVLVVGSGVAGTAAALGAARRGARVAMVSSGTGASVLAGGAIDLEPWESDGSPAAAIDAEARAALAALDAYTIERDGVVLTTLAGLVRPARGADRALLDLAGLAGGEVLVPDGALPGWDARALARAWSDSPFAREREVRFVSVPVQLVQRTGEHDLGDADMAALHDTSERLEWLASRLRGALGSALAVVLPSWLGVERARAGELGALLGTPCGEALAGPGGPSGLRFERARDRALAAAGIAVVAGRVSEIRFEGGWRAAGEGTGDDAAPVFEGTFDAVVLTTGGLVGGGLAYCPVASSLALAPGSPAGPLLRSTVRGPLVVGARAKALEPPSSLFGAAPESHAFPYVEESILEVGGVMVDDAGRAKGAPAGLFAAGEVVADRPRTWLSALAAGAAAGARAGGA